MSNDIKVGDLVYVARPTPCCGSVDSIGDIFKVEFIDCDDSTCTLCNTDATEPIAWVMDDGEPRGHDLKTLEKFRDFPESELTDETRELERQS